MVGIGDDTYVKSSSPGGGTGGEVCRLGLHPVYEWTREGRSLYVD